MRLQILAALTALLVVSGAVAQTAQELLDKAMKAHLEQTAFAGTSSTRWISVTLVREEGQELAESRYDISSQQYRHTDARIRPPDDWAVKVDGQTFSDPQMSRSNFNREVEVKLNGATQSGTANGQAAEVVLKDTPPQQFNDRLRSILSGNFASGYYGNSQDDLVFRYLLPSSRGLSNISWGLLKPEIKREETSSTGSKIYGIAAKAIKGGPILMWIDGSDFHVLRVIQLLTDNTSPRSLQGGYITLSMRFIETVYTYQPARDSNDAGFADFHGPAIDFSLPANQERFVGVTDLVKLWVDEINMTDPDQRTAMLRSRELAREKARAKTQVPVQITPPQPKQGQYLSAAQMSGIIIVEGDKGRASGFMTKIKGVDFVVTNLHVIGANKTIALKTMGGATLPYTAIFGAIGRDIAILRIDKGEGALHLAEDVMKSTKIGQNVVVVGNNAGGGVATEITGNVKGVGPDRIEVDAAFQKGNSGSPIVSNETGDVIGVASYIQTELVNITEWTRSPNTRMTTGDSRWFGFRLDGPLQWEAVKIDKWQEQRKRIDSLRAVSDALASVLSARFQDINEQPRLLALIQDFKTRAGRLGNNAAAYSDEVKDFSRKLRAIAEDDMKDTIPADFYDYYRTCLYWQDNVKAQLSYRDAIIHVLKDCEENPLSFSARLRLDK